LLGEEEARMLAAVDVFSCVSRNILACFTERIWGANIPSQYTVVCCSGEEICDILGFLAICLQIILF
jgi:hypothetical protein